MKLLPRLLVLVLAGLLAGCGAPSTPVISAPKPAAPSRMSSAPVIPLAAPVPAVTPTQAAWPACKALVMASERKACCRPEAKVAAVASAWRITSGLAPSISAAVAAALPKQPTVPVVWKKR